MSWSAHEGTIYAYTKIVSMIRKYHNHKPQTTPWHREEELLNHHETPGSQNKQSNQLIYKSLIRENLSKF